MYLNHHAHTCTRTHNAHTHVHAHTHAHTHFEKINGGGVSGDTVWSAEFFADMHKALGLMPSMACAMHSGVCL